jgi:hypothetical protein
LIAARGGRDAASSELEWENDFEFVEEPDSCSCPQPAPPPGQFSAPNRSGHRWFTPEYAQYPSNIWSLARVVRDRMSVTPGVTALPSLQDIRFGIRNHPCNKRFTAAKAMFMPRFGPDRCAGTGQYYGVIYVPFKFA